MKKVAFDPHGNKVVFYEKEHKYLLEDNPSRRMTSVTTLIKRCFPEFDSQKVAGKVSAKTGRPVEEILEEWRLEGVEGSRLGTLVHALAENILKSNNIDVNSEEGLSAKDLAFLQSLKIFIPKLLERAEFLEAEKIVFDAKRMIAGTIDLLMRSRSTGDLIILDWKTNKKIEHENIFQTGLGNFSHLDDCKLNHYSLQLHVYKKILMDCGYVEKGKDVKLHLIHLCRQESGLVVPHWPPVRNLSREASAILDAA